MVDTSHAVYGAGAIGAILDSEPLDAPLSLESICAGIAVERRLLRGGLSAEDAARKAMDHGMKAVGVFVKGPGAGRESALRAIANSGLKITHIRDVTPIPHNGCRPPKRRRV